MTNLIMQLLLRAPTNVFFYESLHEPKGLPLLLMSIQTQRASRTRATFAHQKTTYIVLQEHCSAAAQHGHRWLDAEFGTGGCY